MRKSNQDDWPAWLFWLVSHSGVLGAFIILLIIIGALAFGARAQEAPQHPAPATSWWQRPAVARCCSDADAVYADEWTAMPDGSIRATVTGGGPRNHAWAPIGRIYIVPPDKVIREPGNPTGRPLLFLAAPSNAHVFSKQPLDLWCFAFGPMT